MRAPPPGPTLFLGCVLALALLVLGGIGLLVDLSGLSSRPIVMPWSGR